MQNCGILFIQNCEKKDTLDLASVPLGISAGILVHPTGLQNVN
jgi:hypothetical protein